MTTFLFVLHSLPEIFHIDENDSGIFDICYVSISYPKWYVSSHGLSRYSMDMQQETSEGVESIFIYIIYKWNLRAAIQVLISFCFSSSPHANTSKDGEQKRYADSFVGLRMKLQKKTNQREKYRLTKNIRRKKKWNFIDCSNIATEWMDNSEIKNRLNAGINSGWATAKLITRIHTPYNITRFFFSSSMVWRKINKTNRYLITSHIEQDVILP